MNDFIQLPQTSPTTTKQGRQTPYLYQQNRGEDDEADINPRDYERQYLGAQVNKANGDLRVIGTNDAGCHGRSSSDHSPG